MGSIEWRGLSNQAPGVMDSKKRRRPAEDIHWASAMALSFGGAFYPELWLPTPSFGLLPHQAVFWAWGGAGASRLGGEACWRTPCYGRWGFRGLKRLHFVP